MDLARCVSDLLITIYFNNEWCHMDFSQFVSDLLATIIGAGLALYGALWLDRKTNARNEEAGVIDTIRRANRVLTLISGELKSNLLALEQIDDNVTSTYRQVKVESWQALSDGGELRPIDDPQLLAVVSNAYADIRHFVLLYQKFFDMKFYRGDNIDPALVDVLRSYTMGAKEQARLSVYKAIQDIGKKLPNGATKAGP
jgi:hypothetical protein